MYIFIYIVYIYIYIYIYMAFGGWADREAEAGGLQDAVDAARHALDRVLLRVRTRLYSG